MTLRALLVLALLAPAAATAVAQDAAEPVHADVDADGTAETISWVHTTCLTPDGEVPPPCPEESFPRGRMQLADPACPGPIRLTGESDTAALVRVIALGSARLTAVALDARSGASARGVDARVYRIHPGADGCARVEQVFRIPSRRANGRAPRGTSFQTAWLYARDYDRRRPGHELRVFSSYGGPTDPGCCPRYTRTTIWGWSDRAERFFVLRTKLRRLPRPG